MLKKIFNWEANFGASGSSDLTHMDTHACDESAINGAVGTRTGLTVTTDKEEGKKEGEE
jgi:hypothetical protein